MNQLLPLIHERRSKLHELFEPLRLRLQNIPQGTLRVSFHGKIPQYYQVLPGHSKTPRYLRKEEHALVLSLAQKEYDLKLFKSMTKEIKLLDSLVSFYETNSPEDVLGHLPDSKASIVTPAFTTNKQFIKEWLDVPYTGLPFSDGSSVHYTQQGLQVRSKSEVLIADLLDKNHIPFRYEFPVRVKGKTIHPDFCILKMSTREEIFWEHFGLLDDRDYRENFMTKLSSYIFNGYYPGINLVMSFETLGQPLNSKIVSRMIDVYCK